jgi:asparagine synthase (glutamine-hydrolysing)
MLRTGLKTMLVDIVLSDRAVQRGYFNRASLETMIARTLGGSNEYQYILWDLLMLEMWHRAFIDAIPEPRRGPIARATVASPA